MKKITRKFILSLSLVFSLMLLVSCATTLRVEVTRPSNLNLNGAKTIAVLPFDKGQFSPFDYVFDYDDKENLNYFEYYSLIERTEEKLLNYLQTSLEKEIQKSSYLSLVNYIPVQTALKYGSEVPSDAFISGEVVSFKVHDLVSKEKKPLPENGIPEGSVSNVIESSPAEGNGSVPQTQNNVKPDFYYEFSYVREVEFIFNYQVIDGKTKHVIDYDTIKIENMSDRVDDKKLLPEIYYMVKDDIDSFIFSLMKDLQPYKEYKSITLLEDKTKNTRMEEADKLAKDGNYKASYKAFLSIYDDINQFEAGYNAAMLLMAMGDLRGAESLMSEVYNNFGNPKAIEALNDIRNEIKQANRLSNQLNSSMNQPDYIKD